jgi:hypothetical protein
MKPSPHPTRHSGKTSNLHGKTTKINPENKQLQTSGSTRAMTVLHQNPQPQLLHNMQTEEHSNGQRSPPCVPKPGPYL